jgi:hypothetical protein
MIVPYQGAIMTSEVLMLNKDAVVIAADSAVTTGHDPHPRYSKAANKIFDLSIHGNVAVTIFAAAEVDLVPWELVLKQFRKNDSSNPKLSKLEDYATAFVAYLENNTSLFPSAVQTAQLKKRFFRSAGVVLERIEALFPDFADANKTPEERVGAWECGRAMVADGLEKLPYQFPLTEADHQYICDQSAVFLPELASIVADSKPFEHAIISELIPLAIDCLVKQPTEYLGYSGLVFAGYGADEIFPSFVHIEVYGHIGSTLLWKEVKRYAITHDNDALILPFAQSSMIDRFTDGFDNAVRLSIYQRSLDGFNSVVSDLVDSGVAIPSDIANSSIEKRHSEFMSAWCTENWNKNFHPLRRVLNSLSVSEMGHLAESLLVLEELRERVTSPSESVGGPIDVAVVTKAEGLLWLKRKHFFDPELNQRYLVRTKSDYNC